MFSIKRAACWQSRPKPAKLFPLAKTKFPYCVQSLQHNPVSVSEDLDHFPLFPFVLPRQNLNLKNKLQTNTQLIAV